MLIAKQDTNQVRLRSRCDRRKDIPLRMGQNAPKMYKPVKISRWMYPMAYAELEREGDKSFSTSPTKDWITPT